MPTPYNRIANQNRDLLAALSDGVFCFCNDTFVLELVLPVATEIDSERELMHALTQ